MKNYEDRWSWVTLVVDGNDIHLYMNGKESDAQDGEQEHIHLYISREC